MNYGDYYMDMNMKMWLEDGVFRIKLYCERFDLSLAKVGVRERLRLCNGVSYPLLSDTRKVKHFDKETRAFLVQPDNITGITAGAFLVNNQLQKILANYFIQINKPPTPAKMFTNEADALNWLQQFKNIRYTA
jgi:hypothetical protein